MERYRIDRHCYEAECEWCATPLYVGDDAWETDSGGLACSRACARRIDDKDALRTVGIDVTAPGFVGTE